LYYTNGVKRTDRIPTTLLEAVRYFADERAAWQCVVNRRWPDGNVVCPRCQSDKVHLIESRMIWRCNGCSRQFSAKIGTIFEESPIPFSKWLPAMWLIANNKNGISSCELARALGVTQKTAWFMLHRIRLAFQNGTIEKVGGKVEVDETFIGGKARNMHKDVKARRITGTGGKDKTLVIGVLKRGGPIQVQVVEDRTLACLQPVVTDTVDTGSFVFTDALRSYHNLGEWYQHQVIDHAVAYVDGEVHTNGLENFWSCLKRTIGGTYVSVEPFHLFRYLDEQAFRFNERKETDSQRFVKVLSQVVGRRLTFDELTGKMQTA
jgi:transposase-like protein